jgi:outer membrane protein OmpA-like peptidoglycan-associated protein
MRLPTLRLSRVGAALTALLPALGGPPGAAQESVPRIPVVPGLVVLSTLQSPDGDRENVVQLESVDSGGVRYSWRLLEVREDGDTLSAQFTRHVRANDLAGAPRIDPVFRSNDPEERPGYTSFTISSAVYTALRDRGTAAFSITNVESVGGMFGAVASSVVGGGLQHRVRYKGTLTRLSGQPAPFPLLVDGLRVTVPALRLQGAFAKGAQRREYEFWVIADSAHPLVLKSVVSGHVFQVTRVDFPPDWKDAEAAAGGVAALERSLRNDCRIELPGVYFAFNSARIDPSSDRSLAALARALTRHPDWTMTVEGHTDSVGTATANQQLSERRAEAVRARLAERHQVDTRAWKAVGYGPSRPRESNATIEGRARNRRVELVRDC